MNRVHSVRQRPPGVTHLRRSSSVPNLRALRDVELSPRAERPSMRRQQMVAQQTDRKYNAFGTLVVLLVLGGVGVWAWMMQTLTGKRPALPELPLSARRGL